ncbi:hypothetical protein AAMO2058_001177400 [Amorphochlora amoebiformis]
MAAVLVALAIAVCGAHAGKEMGRTSRTGGRMHEISISRKMHLSLVSGITARRKFKKLICRSSRINPPSSGNPQPPPPPGPPMSQYDYDEDSYYEDDEDDEWGPKGEKPPPPPLNNEEDYEEDMYDWRAEFNRRQENIVPAVQASGFVKFMLSFSKSLGLFIGASFAGAVVMAILSYIIMSMLDRNINNTFDPNIWYGS